MPRATEREHERDERRTSDLLAERASSGLSAADEERLGEMLEAAGLKDSDDMDLAVAAAMNAFAAADEVSATDDAPLGLRDKLLADADRYFGAEQPGAKVTDIDSARSGRGPRTPLTEPAVTTSYSGRIGWAVAAMLAIVVMFVLRPGGDVPVEILDAAAARAELIAEAPGTTVIEWAKPDIPAYKTVTGDVAWNDERQEGYLRLVGMPMNDPSISQYQLWIVDPDRDANPVDGGVFDVPAGGGEVIIPIDAKLTVSNPDAFAITREQPGGVVVSDGPLLIVAAAS